MSWMSLFWMLVLVSGTSMVASGLVMLVRNRSLRMNTYDAVATVHASQAGKVFRFTTRQGQVMELPAMLGASRFAPGERVEIRCHARLPHVAYIKRPTSWWPSAVTAVLGLALAALGCFGLIGVAP